jgi:hypothetical protein
VRHGSLRHYDGRIRSIIFAYTIASEAAKDCSTARSKQFKNDFGLMAIAPYYATEFTPALLPGARRVSRLVSLPRASVSRYIDRRNGRITFDKLGQLSLSEIESEQY